MYVDYSALLLRNAIAFCSCAFSGLASSLCSCYRGSSFFMIWGGNVSWEHQQSIGEMATRFASRWTKGLSQKVQNEWKEAAKSLRFPWVSLYIRNSSVFNSNGFTVSGTGLIPRLQRMAFQMLSIPRFLSSAFPMAQPLTQLRTLLPFMTLESVRMVPRTSSGKRLWPLIRYRFSRTGDALIDGLLLKRIP